MKDETYAIEARFPVGVSISDDAYRLLIDALQAICDEYEEAHPDRTMWVGGMGGKPPPMWPWVDDGSTGDFDMSVQCFDISERERFEDEKRTRSATLLHWRDERHKLIWQVRDTYRRARQAERLLGRLFAAVKTYGLAKEGWEEVLQAMAEARVHLEQTDPQSNGTAQDRAE